MTTDSQLDRLMLAEQERVTLQAALLAGIKRERAELESLRENMSSHWGYEDVVYRFYHQSFKVYGEAQGPTLRAVELFRKVLPERPFNRWFEKIVEDGTGAKFEHEHNARWLDITRPMLEAFFHARFFVEMMCRYGDLDEPPATLPSGWAAVLYLYDLR